MHARIPTCLFAQTYSFSAIEIVGVELTSQLRINRLTMREATRAFGRNPACMRQFLERGLPKALGYRDSEKQSP